MLFNHRNKVPQSEKRTYTFGIQKDYDGIKLEYTDPDDDERVNYYLSYNSATGEVTEDSSATNPLEITTLRYSQCCCSKDSCMAGVE